MTSSLPQPTDDAQLEIAHQGGAHREAAVPTCRGCWTARMLQGEAFQLVATLRWLGDEIEQASKHVDTQTEDTLALAARSMLRQAVTRVRAISTTRLLDLLGDDHQGGT